MRLRGDPVFGYRVWLPVTGFKTKNKLKAMKMWVHKDRYRENNGNGKKIRE